MEGWETSTLGAVCDLYQPKTISKKDLVEDGPYVVFGANGPIGHYHSFNHADSQIVVTCRGATCGSVNMTPPTCWITGNAMVVAPRDACLNLRFLRYLLLNTDFSSVITGTAQPQITRTTLSPIGITYPVALPEQERIVAILDEAFAAIATATANAEKNLANARELFESQLEQVFTGDAVMEGWKTSTLGKSCQVVNGATPKTKTQEFWEGSHAWVTPAEMGKRTTPYISATQRTLSDAGLQACSASLLPEQSVIISSRAPIGYLVINTVPMATNQGCKGLIPGSGLKSKFLYHYLYHKVDLLNSLGTGATFKELSATKLKEVPVPLPPLPEQERIVAILDEASAKSATLTRIGEQKLAHLDNLKQSLLHKAFTGELTADSKAADRSLSKANV